MSADVNARRGKATAEAKLRKSEAEMRATIADRFGDQIEVIGKFAGLKNPWHLYCKKHKEHFHRAGGFLRKGAGCDKCGTAQYSDKQAKLAREKGAVQFPAKLRERHADRYVLIGEYTSRRVRARFRCVTHGEYMQLPDVALRKRGGCPDCGVIGRRQQSRSITQDEFVLKLRDVNPSIRLIGKYVNKTTRTEFRCALDGYEWKTTPDSVLSGHGCKACDVRKPRVSGPPKAKTYKLGRECISVQGYEPQALDLLRKRYAVDQLRVGKDVPIISYKEHGRSRRYYPDIFIPDEKRIVEVKSSYTLCQNAEALARIKRKRAATIRAGFRFNLMVMTQSGRRIKLPENWYRMTIHALQKLL